MEMNDKMIGIDLGATDIKGVVIGSDGAILHQHAVPTNDVIGEDCSAIWSKGVKSLIAQMRDDHGDVGPPIGISSSGTMHSDNRSVLSNGTKMLGIENFVWKDYLKEECYVINDAHAALFAESRIGAGQDCKDIVMLTLGTGVGGAIMIDNKLIQGQFGRAGHLGHMSVNQHLNRSIVNTPGSIENAIGDFTVKARSYGRFQNTKEIVEAYKAGDTFATWLWMNFVETLARGVVSYMNMISPELVVLGGGIAQAGDDMMNPLHDFLDVYEWRPIGMKTEIKLAELGPNAGAIGAALFAKEKINQG